MDEGAPLLPPLPLAGGDRGVGARFRLGRPTAAAKALRNEATLHEQLLWRQLKGRRLFGLKFTRQMPIAGYIVDFACREHILAVELDGSQHGDAVAYDAARTSAIEHAGYRVLRFWNNDLTSHMTGVLEMIADAALRGERAPTPYPLPQAGGEDSGPIDPDTGTADA
nr:DUF559 domain-containing protein [Sphingomonas sp. TREG-RG-20F-R18-01]